MILRTVYPDADVPILYEILQERTPDESISHRKMPTMAEHTAFVQSNPYLAWYIVLDRDQPAGAVYLTIQDEIGVQILARHRRKGLAKKAIQELMTRHPRERYLANINPRNAKSIDLFSKLGFKLLQLTYELRA